MQSLSFLRLRVAAMRSVALSSVSSCQTLPPRHFSSHTIPPLHPASQSTAFVPQAAHIKVQNPFSVLNQNVGSFLSVRYFSRRVGLSRKWLFDREAHRKARLILNHALKPEVQQNWSEEVRENLLPVIAGLMASYPDGIETLHAQGALHALTVNDLKAFIREKGIETPLTGKKVQLLAAVSDYFSSKSANKSCKQKRTVVALSNEAVEISLGEGQGQAPTQNETQPQTQNGTQPQNQEETQTRAGRKRVGSSRGNAKAEESKASESLSVKPGSRITRKKVLLEEDVTENVETKLEDSTPTRRKSTRSRKEITSQPEEKPEEDEDGGKNARPKRARQESTTNSEPVKTPPP